MKLTAAQILELSEIPSYIINEDGEGPLWRFKYDKYRTDPRPQVLVLGSYRHPRTGNLLVGGVNVNYLNNRQRERLRLTLPRLMKARNLYYRYHSGLRHLPDIFDAFYRTYDPRYIRAVDKSILYPKQTVDQARRALAQARLDQIQKDKETRLQQAMPKYPSDISRMDKTLDQKTKELALKPASEQPPIEPEVAHAKANYDKIVHDRENALKVKNAQSVKDARRPQGYVAPEPTTQPTRQDIAKEIGRERKIAAQELQKIAKQPQPDALAPRKTQIDVAPDIADTDDDIDLMQDETGLDESIVYYDPRYNKYIIEPAYKLISDWAPKFNGHRSNDKGRIS